MAAIRRAGLVGFGMMGRNHARVLAFLDGVRLVGIVDLRPPVDSAPFALDSLAAERLSKVFADRGLIGAVGHIERFNPALQHMRQRLDSGQLGEVFQVVTRRQGPFPARIADVGVVMDLATHDIDLTTWVTRRAYATVAAHTAKHSGREHEDLVAVVGGLAVPPRRSAGTVRTPSKAKIHR